MTKARVFFCYVSFHTQQLLQMEVEEPFFFPHHFQDPLLSCQISSQTMCNVSVMSVCWTPAKADQLHASPPIRSCLFATASPGSDGMRSSHLPRFSLDHPTPASPLICSCKSAGWPFPASAFSSECAAACGWKPGDLVSMAPDLIAAPRRCFSPAGWPGHAQAALALRFHDCGTAWKTKDFFFFFFLRLSEEKYRQEKQHWTSLLGVWCQSQLS